MHVRSCNIISNVQLGVTPKTAHKNNIWHNIDDLVSLHIHKLLDLIYTLVETYSTQNKNLKTLELMFYRFND